MELIGGHKTLTVKSEVIGKYLHVLKNLETNKYDGNFTNCSSTFTFKEDGNFAIYVFVVPEDKNWDFTTGDWTFTGTWTSSELSIDSNSISSLLVEDIKIIMNGEILETQNVFNVCFLEESLSDVNKTILTNMKEFRCSTDKERLRDVLFMGLTDIKYLAQLGKFEEGTRVLKIINKLLKYD